MALAFISQGNSRLPVVIFMLVLKSILEDYRKLSSEKGMRTSPTNTEDDTTAEGDDYRLIASTGMNHCCLPEALRRASINIGAIWWPNSCALVTSSQDLS
jgi:hypothetical protein